MRIHRHRQRKPKFNVPTFRVNEKIDVPEIHLIGEEGVQGVMATDKAIALAKSKEMDLVEVSPKAIPPVCKIIDYSHFKYQKEKEARKQKAQSKEVEVKGIRLTFRIGPGDFETRVNQAKKFLERGDKIKVELVLRGREKAHKDVARVLLERFLEAVRAHYEIRIEQKPAFQGGRLTVTVARV
jgi:translation initiation factor IF-3